MECLIELTNLTKKFINEEDDSNNIFQFNNIVMREEVLDRLLDISSIIKKNQIPLLVDYELHIKELIAVNPKDFNIEKALQLLQTMQDSKEVEIYYNLHNLIKKYYIDVMRLYINSTF